ncbi:MAG: phosphoribosyltransferase [Acidimicrobiia bacterium]|nr:phosphoribosyltransferase [Acidimicrobiia bacterium]
MASYANRADAGRRLAEELLPLFEGRRPVVLGLPRGGVPLAAEVSAALQAPLDVLVVRKIPTPGQPELALGAVGEGDVKVLNKRIVAALGLNEDQISQLAAALAGEVEDRLRRFRGGDEGIPIRDRDVIVVDDGMATGASMMAAIAVASAQGVGSVTVAVPVASVDAVKLVSQDADKVVTMGTPRYFRAVGEWYADFTQTTEEEVIELLARYG